MLREDISYVDFNGDKQTDVCYFHLSKAEIGRMQVRMDGKFIDHLKDLVSGNHVEELYDIFYNLILDSYGEKSEDGKRFVKTPEKRAEFESSIAFSELFASLIMDMDKMSAFTQRVIPPDLIKKDEAPAIIG